MADLNSLVIFAKVVEASSFSRAARLLGIPTSTVSRRIAELEAELGVQLLERSTRSLRVTDVGAEILALAQHGYEISESVDNIVSNHLADVSGFLRLSAPPSISDTLIAPLIGAFQAAYPNVRVQVFITERFVNLITEGIDVVFGIDVPSDPSLVIRKLLNYRHQLVASPSYLAACTPPQSPRDLANHRLLAFSHGRPENDWHFTNVAGGERRKFTFRPALSMNDFTGLATALVSGTGICDLPPVVQPHLLRSGLLVEVMPKWRFNAVDLSLVHLRNRYVPRTLRVFNEFAIRMVPTLFTSLPI